MIDPAEKTSPHAGFATAMGRGVVLGLQFALLAVVPLLAAIFGGRALDRQFGTSPILLLLAIALAFLITIVAIARQVRTLLSEQRP